MPQATLKLKFWMYRWGPIVEQHTYKQKQRLYLSEQVCHVAPGVICKSNMMLSMLLQTDGSEPNKLVIMNADVVKVVSHSTSAAEL